MKPILTLALAGALAAGCTVTGTPWNPDCERRPYLDACWDAPERKSP